MSGTLMNISAPVSGSTTPRSRIDALSRDDLVRFVKKQIDKLKEAKCENEKVENELNEMRIKYSEFEEKWHAEHEKNAEKTMEIEKLSKKYNEMKTECSNLALRLTEMELQLKEHQEAKNISELEGGEENAVVRELRNELASIKNLLREQSENCDKNIKEKEKLICTVAELRSLLDDAHAQLECYNEKRSAENVMTLEIADYEKTVERLQKELQEATDDRLSLRSELEVAKKELEGSCEEKIRLQDSITKLKTALRKLKKEGEEKKEELAQREKEKENLEKQLEGQISARNEEREQMTTVVRLNEEKISYLEAANASLNRQLISLRSQRESLQRQFDDLSLEHSNFKTRALYVLEQKKSENDEYTKEEIEMLQETIRQQKKAIENLGNSNRLLQSELDLSVERAQTLSNELSCLQQQFTTAAEIHQIALAEQRQQFESRLASEVKLSSDLLAQIDANFKLHHQEKENLLLNAQQERESLVKEMENLKSTLNEETRLRKEAERMQAATVTAQSMKVQFHKPATDFLPVRTCLKRSLAAEDLEKKEGVKSDECEEHYTDKTLEEVIYGEDEGLNMTDVWNQPPDSVSWQNTVQITVRQLEHTRELLNESEATNAKLLEQSKLLKEEIRRMERNYERENHLANTEYLKNVIMKFIAPQKVTDERGQLVPVLATMLKLNSVEVDVLNQIAQAEKSAVATNITKASIWGTYLWPNFS